MSETIPLSNTIAAPRTAARNCVDDQNKTSFASLQQVSYDGLISWSEAVVVIVCAQEARVFQ